MLRQGTLDETSTVWLIACLRRRYPYIFGRQKAVIAAENNLYHNIANSLCQIYLRSPNREFKKAGKKLFQRLAEKTESRCDGSWDRLTNLQTAAGQMVFTQAEVHSRRSLTQEDNSEDEIDTEDRFKTLISRSLAALYISTVRPGKRDFELKTLDASPSGSEPHERTFSDEDKEDDLGGEDQMEILEPDVPSTDTAMDEVDSGDLMTPAPESPLIPFADKDDCRTTNFSPDLSDDFSPLDEEERRDGAADSDAETAHDDLFFVDEDQSSEAAEQGSLSDHGGSDSELLDWPGYLSHPPPLPPNAEKSLDLFFDDQVRLPDWSCMDQNEGFSRMDSDHSDVDMLDLESPLIPPDDLPSRDTSLNGPGDEHPPCLEQDTLLLSPVSHCSVGSLDSFEIEML
ncbi:hypothetical protein FRC01_005244 [Tulasnella sp. 417]|nr:hypothetical protein FRC01_005244 [Tulasnella sp. 417]